MKNWLIRLVVIFSLVTFVTCTTSNETENNEELPLPAAPTNLVASAVDSAQINLVWYTVSGATGYKVYQSTVLDSGYSEISNVSSNSYVNFGLSSNTKYFYKVMAYNVNGNSDFSNIASALTFVSTPGNLRANSVSSSRIDLVWDTVNGEARYRIYKSSSKYGIYNKIAEAKNNSYINTGLKANTVYYYKVKAYNAGGNSDYSNIAYDTTIVTEPTNLTAVATNSLQIFVSWDAVKGAEGYHLYRASGNSDKYLLIYDGDATSYSDTISDPEVRYLYKLEAYRGSKVSDFSDAIEVKSNLLKPEGLVFYIQDQTKISLSWHESSGATGYSLYRSADNGISYSTRYVGEATSYNDFIPDPDKEYFYRLKAYNAVDTSEFSEIVKVRINVTAPEYLTAVAKSSSRIDLSWSAVAGALGYNLYGASEDIGYSDLSIVSDTFYQCTGLKANTAYTFKVQTYNSAHKSKFTDVVICTTLVAAPGNLTGSVVGESQIDLSWDAVAGAQGYYLYLSADGGKVYNKLSIGDKTSYQSTGLLEGKTYYYKVAAYNDNGEGESSDILIASTKISFPANVTAKAVSASQINISWDSVAAADGYKLYHSTSSDGDYSVIDLGEATSYQSVGLTANTSYYYKVTAYNAEGESDFSSIVSNTTIVAVPDNFSCKIVDSTQLDLSWSKVAGATGYFLCFSQDGGQSFSNIPAGTDTLYHSKGLKANTEYFYAVQAYNDHGYSGFSDTLSSYTTVIAPKNVIAEAKSSSRIDISWDKVDGADGYYLLFSVDGVSYSDTAVGDVTTYSHTGLAANTIYYYRVKAYSAAGDSKASSTVGCTTIITAPKNVSATAISSKQIDLVWDSVPGAISYTIYRATSSGGDYSNVGTVDGESYSDSTGLSAYTQYYYRVTTHNLSGQSDSSEVINVTTIVAAPANLTDSVVSASQIDISWDKVIGADGYHLWMSEDGIDYSDTDVGDLTSYSHTGLAANSIHYYKVVAYNSSGMSDSSQTLIVTTIVAAPKSLSATAISSAQIDLVWDSVPGATGYKIYQADSTGTYAEIDLVNDTLYHSVGLSPNTEYSYRVTAYSDVGESALSSEAGDTTIVVAPSNFTCSVVSVSQIDLSWSSVTGATGYRLWYSENGVNYSDTIVGDVTSYSDTGLAANSVHYYKVTAFNTNGESIFSDALSATTIVTPPEDVTAIAISSSQIGISWSVVAGATSYTIYRAPTSNGTYDSIGVTSGLIYSDSAGLSTNIEYFYKVSASCASGVSEYSPVVSCTTLFPAPANIIAAAKSSSRINLSWDSVPGASGYIIHRATSRNGVYDSVGSVDSLSYEDSTGLSAYTNYYYKVTAYNVGGQSKPSEIKKVATRVAAPSTFVGEAVSTSQINLSWSSVAGAIGYRLSLSSDGTNYSDKALGDVTSYSDTGLAANSIHYYKVAAYNTNGDGGLSLLSVTTRVLAPTNLVVTTQSSSQIDLTWEAVAGATSYIIYRDTAVGGDYASIGVASSEGYSDTGLEANKVYYYKVTASSDAGESNYSNIASDTTIVAAPGNLTYEIVSSSQINLSWDSVAGATCYNVYQSSPFNEIVVRGITNTFRNNAGLVANTTYDYKVTALNANGESEATSLPSMTTRVLAPTNLGATAQNFYQIDLVWDSVAGATSYTIYRNTSEDGIYDSVGETSSRAYSDSIGLTANIEYFYKVSARSASGESEYSSVASDTTTFLVPANLIATGKSSSRISLSWDSVPGATSYIIYRALSSEGSYDDVGTASSASYEDSTGLSAYTEYYYKVTAYNIGGQSKPSEIKKATTTVAAPGNLTYEVVSSSQINLSWDSVAGATSYTIYRALASAGDYSEVGTATSESYQDNSGLTANTAYLYKVTASNTNGESEATSLPSVTTRVLAPTNLVATSQSSSQIDLTWDSVAEATSYIIYRDTAVGGDYASIGVVSSEGYSDTGLEANKVYYYKVTASSDAGESDYSSFAKDTTIVAAPGNLTYEVASSSQINLSWDSVAGATSYTIYRALASAGDYSEVGTATSESYQDNSGLTANTAYLYKVTASNTNGESEAASLPNVITRVPAPTNLVATAQNFYQIDLVWDSVAEATSYTIYRNTSEDGTYDSIGETSSLAYSDSAGLTANIEYFYKVTARNASGESKLSSFASDTTIFPAPEVFSAIATGSSQIDLSWGSVTGAIGYRIYRLADDGNYNKIGETENLTYQSTGLSANTEYFYKIKAHTATGESDYSSVISDTTIVAAPTNLTDSVLSASQIKLRWDPVDGATYYKLYTSDSSNGNFEYVVSYSESYTFVNLLANKKYYYKVTAKNTNGESDFSETLSVTTIVTAPTGVSATGISSVRIDVSWSTVAGATSYTIYRAESSNGTYDSIGVASSTNYSDTGLDASKEYYYKVTASSDAGESAYSGFASGITTAAAPGNLTCKVVSSTQIDLNWGPVAGANGYRLYYSTDGINYSDKAVGNVTAYSHTGLAPNSVHYYKVKALSDAGDSDYSNIVSDTTIVAAPTGVSATSISSSQIKVSWGTVAGATSYTIYRAESSNGTYDSIGVASSTDYSDTGLDTNKEYYYKVTANNTNGESEFSSIVSATTRVGIPTGLAKNSCTSSQISLRWNAVEGATGYFLYRSNSSSGNYVYIGKTTSTSYTNTGLSASTTYYYKVLAHNTNGVGEKSGPLAVTTNIEVKAPSSLTAKTTKFDQIDLSWSAVSGVIGYKIYRSISSSSGYAYIDSTTGTTYIDDYLVENIKRYYKVKACYSSGEESGYSPSASATTFIKESTLRGKINNGEDVTQVNTGLITNMSELFKDNSDFNQDISGWDVSHVTNMSSMFEGASNFNQYIGNWDVSHVTDMSIMFKGATVFNQDISDWDVSNVTNMLLMFKEATVFNQDISDWDVSSVTNMMGMFKNTDEFNQNLNSWNVSNVTNMSLMFSFTKKFNSYIGSWNVSKVTDMGHMFWQTDKFNQNISGWNTGNVTNMSYMFTFARSFNQNLSGWNVGSVTNHDYFDSNADAWSDSYKPHF